jgi:hypothetical protein
LEGPQGPLELWNTLAINLDRQVVGDHGSQVTRQRSVPGTYLQKNVTRSGLDPTHDSLDNPCIS